jgi:hypothetical protein
MQIIHSPGKILAAGNASGSTNVIAVTAALNVRGVIIQEVTTRYMLQAVNSTAALNISGAVGTLQSHAVFDLNGAAGPVNVPLAYSCVKEVQYPAGADVIVQIAITGTVILGYTVVGKIL